MKITRENIDNLSAVVKVLIEKSDYDKNVSDKLREYRNKAVIPGFRPGKVPAGLIQKRFGKAILADEVNQLLSQNLTNWLRDEKIMLLGDPLPSLEHQKPIDWDKDSDFEFAFDLAIAPQIELDLEKLEPLDYHRIIVDDKMIDENIEEIRGRLGKLRDGQEIALRSSVKGTFTQLDSIGEPLNDGIVAEETMLLPDLIKDENIKNEFLGKTLGDVLVFDPVSAFGDRHEVGHMLNISHEQAQQLEGNFSFTITEIRNYEKAELNEELFNAYFGEEAGVTDLETFREKISEEIARSLERSSDQKFAADSRNTLVNNLNIELPETFLKRWLKETNKEMTDEQVENDFGPFITDLKWQLIKSDVIKANQLDVSEEETFDLARYMAYSQYQQYGIYQVADEHIDSLANRIIGRPEEKERLVRRLYESKVIQTLKEKCVLNYIEVTSDQFQEMIK